MFQQLQFALTGVFIIFVTSLNAQEKSKECVHAMTFSPQYSSVTTTSDIYGELADSKFGTPVLIWVRSASDEKS